MTPVKELMPMKKLHRIVITAFIATILATGGYYFFKFAKQPSHEQLMPGMGTGTGTGVALKK